MLAERIDKGKGGHSVDIGTIIFLVFLGILVLVASSCLGGVFGELGSINGIPNYHISSTIGEPEYHYVCEFGPHYLDGDEVDLDSNANACCPKHKTKLTCQRKQQS